MKRIHRIGLITVACATMMFSTSATQAGVATSNLDISATVVANCTITASAVAFSNYDPVVANAASDLDGTGGVTIACTKDTTVRIDLGLGSNANLTTRRMSDGSNFLTYELYQDNGRTTVWGSGVGNGLEPAAAPDYTARTFTVYGRVTAAQDVPSGAYSDTVVATVNF